jgi:hypothetical protein
MGTTTYTGTTIVCLPNAFSDAHVSGAAIRAAKHSAQSPYWLNTNSVLRNEPTWGDVDILATVIPRLQPMNVTQLVAAFSAGHASAKALQCIRNATAHNNLQAQDDIKALHSLYVVFPVTHPTHALFWIEPTSNDFLLTQAIEDLIAVGLSAIS